MFHQRLKPPTVARVKKADQVLNYALTVERMDLASFETIVLDLTRTEQVEQGEGSAEAESNSLLVVHAFLRGFFSSWRQRWRQRESRVVRTPHILHSKALVVRDVGPLSGLQRGADAGKEPKN